MIHQYNSGNLILMLSKHNTERLLRLNGVRNFCIKPGVSGILSTLGPAE